MGYEDAGLIVLSLPLRLNKQAWEANRENSNMFIKKLQMAAKKGNWGAIMSNLVEAKLGSGSSDSKAATPIRQLPELEEIPLKSVKKVMIGERVSWIMTVIDPNTNEEHQVWAPSSLSKMFNLGAIITTNTRFLYNSYLNGSGKECITAQLLNYDLPQDDSNLMELFI